MAAQERGTKICHVCKIGVPWAWRDTGGWLCSACEYARSDHKADVLAMAKPPRQHEWDAARQLRTAVACIESGDITRVDYLMWVAESLMKRAERARKLEAIRKELEGVLK